MKFRYIIKHCCSFRSQKANILHQEVVHLICQFWYSLYSTFHAADEQQSSSAGSDTLEPRLEDLQHLVKMYPEKWRAFGRQLNIDPEMLDIIWKESNRNPEDAFNQVLLIWKSRKTVPYTWCTMCDILETHEVGCSSLSYDIKSKKWTPQQQGNWHFHLGKYCTIKIRCTLGICYLI